MGSFSEFLPLDIERVPISTAPASFTFECFAMCSEGGPSGFWALKSACMQQKVGSKVLDLKWNYIQVHAADPYEY